MIRLLTIAASMVWVLSSCGPERPVPDTVVPEANLPTESEYFITVNGTTADGQNIGPYTLEGDSFQSNWDYDFSYVYLGTDEINEPLGTFSADVFKIGDDYVVRSATLSKTDVRVGTSAELNARTYHYVEPSTGFDGEFSVTYLDESIIVVDYFRIPMKRVITTQGQMEESVWVSGRFIVVK